ncbi:hypothetical protein BDK51DRAFT_33601, partial [Blyttiomyces helicus]
MISMEEGKDEEGTLVANRTLADFREIRFDDNGCFLPYEFLALESMQAIATTAASLDFFIAAADLAYKKSNKHVLKGVLRQILRCSLDWSVDVNRRCLVRLAKADGSDAEVSAFIEKAHSLLKDWTASNDSETASSFEHEIDWLYRISWNMAVATAKDGTAVELSCRFFKITADLLTLNRVPQISTLHCIKTCYYAALAGHLVLARLTSPPAPQHLEAAHEALKALRSAEEDLRQAGGGKPGDAVGCQSVYLEFELRVKRKEWEKLKDVVAFADANDAPVNVFERMADIVTRHDCPTAIVFMTVQATLDAILKRDPDFDLARFSQWFRALARIAIVSGKESAIIL